MGVVQQGEPGNYIVLVSKILSLRFLPYNYVLNAVEDRRLQSQRTALFTAQHTTWLSTSFASVSFIPRFHRDDNKNVSRWMSAHAV